MRVGTGILLSVGLMASSGCGGSGETLHLDVLPPQQPVPEGVTAMPTRRGQRGAP